MCKTESRRENRGQSAIVTYGIGYDRPRVLRVIDTVKSSFQIRSARNAFIQFRFSSCDNTSKTVRKQVTRYLPFLCLYIPRVCQANKKDRTQKESGRGNATRAGRRDKEERRECGERTFNPRPIGRVLRSTRECMTWNGHQEIDGRSKEGEGYKECEFVVVSRKE